jgi:hypothetical protein
MFRLLPILLGSALAATAPLSAAEPLAVPHFDSIELRGGGDVTLAPGPVQRVTILEGDASSARIHVDGERKLVIEACGGDCRPNLSLHIRVEAPRIPDALAVHGGGAIHVDPGFPHVEDVAVAVEGGGIIDIRALNAEDVAAAVQAGGRIFTRPLSSLAAAINLGGEIHYSGDAQVSTSIDGGGKVLRD